MYPFNMYTIEISIKFEMSSGNIINDSDIRISKLEQGTIIFKFMDPNHKFFSFFHYKSKKMCYATRNARRSYIGLDFTVCFFISTKIFVHLNTLKYFWHFFFYKIE